MKYRYELWQMTSGDENRHLRFVGLEDLLDKFGYVPDKNEYDQVWEDEIEDKYRIRAAVPILNELFDIFNLSHPEGYKGKAKEVRDVYLYDYIECGRIRSASATLRIASVLLRKTVR